MARVVVSLVILAILLPMRSLAQQVSGLTGMVTDSTGSAVPDVSVRLENTFTGAGYETKTNSRGSFLFLKLPPGQGYRLTFTKESFRTLTIENVILGVGVTETQNGKLELGSLTQTIEVKAAGEATLNTTDATIGNVIDTRRIQELPVQIRANPARLLGLQPGVVANTGGGSNRDGAVTGARTDQGNITLDGIDVNDQAGGFAFTTVVGAPIDSVQEFRAVTSNPLSGDGRSSGAQIQLVTKSGTNDWHGSLREFHRNTITAANSFFNNKSGTSRPRLIRNQFGGSLGGHVVRDKLFFFFDYEGRRDARGFSNNRTVPLAHVYEGRVAYINNGPGCSRSSTLLNQPACISIAPASQVASLDPQGIGANSGILGVLRTRYPVGDPSLGGNGVNTGGFIFNSPVALADNVYTTRIDYRIGQHHSLFGRFSIDRFSEDRTDGPIQQFPIDPKSVTSASRDYGFVIGHTWTINPNTTNQLTVGLTKQIFSFDVNVRPTFPNSFTFAPSSSGAATLSAPFVGLSSQSRTIPVVTIRDDFSHLYRSHHLQAGVNIRPIRQNSTLQNDFNFLTIGLGGLNNSLNASLRPSNILSTPPAAAVVAQGQWDSMFAFLLGRYASESTRFNYDNKFNASPPGTGQVRSFNYNEYEAYIQDSWRLTGSLNFNYGVRWSYYSVPYETSGIQAGNDVDLNGLLRTRLNNAAAGISGASAEPLLSYDLIGQANGKRGYYGSNYNNFAPRLSMAWNPSFRNGVLGHVLGDRKTVLRFGGAMTYDRIAGSVTFIQNQVSFLFSNVPSTFFGNTSATTALQTDPRFTDFKSLPVINTPPAVTVPFTPNVDAAGNPIGTRSNRTNYTVAQDFRTPYTYNYTLSLQRDVPGNFIVEAAYVGRLGRKLFAQGDAAQTLNFRDPVSGQMMFAAFRSLQQELNNPNVTRFTPQPWFENVVNQGIRAIRGSGLSCTSFGAPNCTELVGGTFGNLISIGDVSDTIQALFGNRLLDYNVGLSSQFATNAYIGNFASSNYNGLLLSLRHRYSHGLQYDFNYTFSHSIDNNSVVVNNSNNFSSLVCDLTNLRTCRGSSDFDARHIISVNFTYELPFGRGRWLGNGAPGWANHIIGGWEVAGIQSWRTGFPVSTTTGAFPISFVLNSPALLSGAQSALAVNLHTDTSGNVQYFADPAAAQDALRNPLPGEYGPRNTIRGPGFSNLDLAVLKKFTMPWKESHKLTFRWESFNAFNHPSFLEPNLNINSTNFGRITAERSTAREMQFALRYDF